MRSALITSLILLFAFPSFAQKIKVRKVKGNQALVEFTEAGALQMGQVYELAPDDFSGSGSGGNARDYVVGLSFSLYNTKSDVANSNNETDLSLSARLGWNLVNFEIGPLFTYTSDDNSGFTTTILKAGAFADYNFIGNIPGEIFVYGVGGSLAMGQRDSGSGTKSDIMEVFGGGFVKWFPTGGSFAIRMDGGYAYQKVSSSSTDATITGLGLLGSLQAYF